MTFNELSAEQGESLDYKITKAVEAIRLGLSVCRHRPALAFSGGKDSTVLWHLMRTHFPEWNNRLAIIYGNTGVEYPESLQFARQLGKEWGGENFYETRPLKTEKDGLKYEAQRQVLEWIVENDRLREILQEDGKLKSTDILERVCPPELWARFKKQRLIWPAGTEKNYFWCVDQYGWPLLGKAFSKLKAHRINIDCFLKYSKSLSEDAKTLAYYEILREVKISQACCDVLKKEPSEALQATLGIDVIFKGLMASESRTRATNFLTRGYLFESQRKYLGRDSFYHCNPISIWTDQDIWDYIRRFHVPYAPLYDMGWTDAAGEWHTIPRNGCMACGTDLLYPNNHLATLRHTHPQAWRAFMKKGMAAEIQKLQQAKRSGQLSLLDFIADTDYLIENRPCAFDRIDRLVLDELSQDGAFVEYDPEDIELPLEQEVVV